MLRAFLKNSAHIFVLVAVSMAPATLSAQNFICFETDGSAPHITTQHVCGHADIHGQEVQYQSQHNVFGIHHNHCLDVEIGKLISFLSTQKIRQSIEKNITFPKRLAMLATLHKSAKKEQRNFLHVRFYNPILRQFHKPLATIKLRC